MGKGRELGRQLRQWLEAGEVDLDRPVLLANRLVDALGSEERLRSPVRDLAAQPLLRAALRQRGSARRAALGSLVEQLESTYAPVVLGELLDLLEAASGVALDAEPPAADEGEWQPSSVPSDEPPEGGPALDPEPAPAPAPVPAGVPVRGSGGGAVPSAGPAGLAEQLRGLGPGLALAAAAALVWRWSAAELDAWLLDGGGWSGGLVLVAVLVLLQALALGPLRRLRRDWPLEAGDADDPRGAWRWIAAPWIHHAHREAVVNLLVLLLILGPSPLDPAAVVFRYALTCLATMAPAVLVARRRGVEGRWDGASGAVSALIGLGAGASLLHWRVLEYGVGAGGQPAVPAWVLLLVYGALQLRWQLPRRGERDGSRPVDRLLSCQWWWGLVLGLLWALISRIADLLPLAQASQPA